MARASKGSYLSRERAHIYGVEIAKNTLLGVLDVISIAPK